MNCMASFANILLFLLLLNRYGESGISQNPQSGGSGNAMATPILISASTGMETAWDIPRAPRSDLLPPDSLLAGRIRRGFEIFLDTPRKAKRFSGNQLSCNNCHLNGGQREKSMPLIGVAGVFPEFNKRAGRPINLEDRIINCFLRSENAAGSKKGSKSYPEPKSEEVVALSAYITWLSSGQSIDTALPWRGQNIIPVKNIISLDKLDRKLGRILYGEKCNTCHGNDGQGVWIGDKKAGPLWGPNSWNDGAGAARIYTLAGMIRFSMPYLDPESLTDEEAQHIAAYIDSKPRPVFPLKDQDYPGQKIPVDAVYYVHSKK